MLPNQRPLEKEVTVAWREDLKREWASLKERERELQELWDDFERRYLEFEAIVASAKTTAERIRDSLKSSETPSTSIETAPTRTDERYEVWMTMGNHRLIFDVKAIPVVGQVGTSHFDPNKLSEAFGNPVSLSDATGEFVEERVKTFLDRVERW